MFKRKNKVYLELTAPELQLLRRSLMNWRNRLLAQGRHTDPIDEILIRLMA